MSEYRKRKQVPVLLNKRDGIARIRVSDLPEKALEDFCVYNGKSELDVVEKTDTYIDVSTEGAVVDTLTVAYDEIPEEEYDFTPLVAISSVIVDSMKRVEDAIYVTEQDEEGQKELATLLERIERSVSDVSSKNVPDYTNELDALLEAIVARNSDTTIADKLDTLIAKEDPAFEIPPQLISGDRIKVEVDRIGMGGGGSDVTTMENSLSDIYETLSALNRASSRDAFGRQRTSEPYTLFDSKQIFDNQPLFWDDQQTSGSGTSSTHSAYKACSTMGVSATTAGTRVRQTFQWFNYQPGKSHLIYFTFGNLKSVSGITKRVGYFNGSNGLFFEHKDGVAKVVRRTNATGTPTDNPVVQSSWNVDKMDGTGASGVTLDFSMTQIGFIDFEWLGVGIVRMGFVVDGVKLYCHHFLNANNLATVYMSTPNLPVRYEISNSGSGAADTLDHICSSVISEGGQQYNGILHHADSGAVSGLASATAYVIMGGRLKSAYLGANIILENVSIIGSANDQAHWEFVVGGTVGAALSFSDKTYSAVQIAIGSSSHTHTGGVPIDGGYFTTNQAAQFTVPNAVKLGSNIAGTPQEWYLVVTPITNNITVRASVTWRELN